MRRLRNFSRHNARRERLAKQWRITALRGTARQQSASRCKPKCCILMTAFVCVFNTVISIFIVRASRGHSEISHTCSSHTRFQRKQLVANSSIISPPDYSKRVILMHARPRSHAPLPAVTVSRSKALIQGKRSGRAATGASKRRLCCCEQDEK